MFIQNDSYTVVTTLFIITFIYYSTPSIQGVCEIMLQTFGWWFYRQKIVGEEE